MSACFFDEGGNFIGSELVDVGMIYHQEGNKAPGVAQAIPGAFIL
jgi:hypothetical protein